MKLKYGTRQINIDITSVCFDKLLSDNIIKIPQGNETCDSIFGDPVYGIKKKIFKTNDDDDILEEFDDLHPIIIYVQMDDLNLTHDGLLMLPSLMSNNNNNKVVETYDVNKIYNSVKIIHGKMSSEKKIHQLCANYLFGNEKILEIRGNIGTTTLFMASILNNYNSNNDRNLVTVEPNADMSNKLEENKKINNFNFHIETSILTKKISNSEVATITYEELKNKYNIIFDTLVIDCDGGLYNILHDTPEILDDVNLIIMKNDYDRISKKTYIDEVLTHKNFERKCTQRGGWGACCNNFFEVWMKL